MECSKGKTMKQIHVTPRPDGWAVKRPGTTRASFKTTTQREAIERAREIARREKSELVVHGKDRKIRQKNSYGNDPYPPKG